MNEEHDKAREKILSAAKAILGQEISVIEGARAIAALRFAAQMDADPDVLPFVGVDSETDALPLGEVRRHWKPEALAALAPEIERAEQWAKTLLEPYCQRLVGRLSSKAQ